MAEVKKYAAMVDPTNQMSQPEFEEKKGPGEILPVAPSSTSSALEVKSHAWREHFSAWRKNPANAEHMKKRITEQATLASQSYTKIPRKPRKKVKVEKM